LPNERPQDDVLTLHRDIAARFASIGNIAKSRAFLGAIGKSERMMAHLAGLSGAMHGFSAQAWAMATAIVDAPALCARLGIEARALRMEELADLVQVALEQEESVELEALGVGMQATAPGRVVGKKAPTTRLHPLHPVAPQTRKGQSALARRVQQLVREVRGAVHGSSPTVAELDARKVGSADPGQMGYGDLAAAQVSVDGVAPTPVASGSQVLRSVGGPRLTASRRPQALSSEILERFRVAAQASSAPFAAGERAAHLAQAPGWAAGGASIGYASLSRALRWNADATELAFLAGDVAGGAHLADPAADVGETAAAGHVGAVAPRRALSAAIASAAAAQKRAENAERLAGPAVARGTRAVSTTRKASPSAARAPAIADLAERRLAATAPHWQRTLRSWADAADVASPPASGREASPGSATARGRSAAVFAASSGPATTAPAAPDESFGPVAEFVALAPYEPGDAAAESTGRAAGTPHWLRSPAAARAIAQGGAVGLRAEAMTRGLLARHDGGLSARFEAAALESPADAALAPWRSRPQHAAAYRAPSAERTALALGEAPEGAMASPDVPPAQATRDASGRTSLFAARAAVAAVGAVARQLAQVFSTHRPTHAAAASRGLMQFAQASPAAARLAAERALAVPLGARVVDGSLSAPRAFAVPSRRRRAESLAAAALFAVPSESRGHAAGAEAEFAWLDAGAEAAPADAAPSVAAPRARSLAAGATAALVPAAVRAALAVFGERPTDDAASGVTTAYLARFFGRAESAAARGASGQRRTGRADADRTVVDLHEEAGFADDATTPARQGARRGLAAVANAGKSPASQLAAARGEANASGEPVLRGMAALEALLAGPAAADAALERSAEREMRVPAAEQALLTPASERAAGDAGVESAAPESLGGGARSPAAQRASAWPSAKLHAFAPVGLGRGRGLFGHRLASPARAGALSARATNARPSGAASWSARRPAVSAAGYGSAALGGGELLGLGADASAVNAEDATGFFGENAAAPQALRGADALAGWVTTRRGGAPIRGHAAAVAGFAREGATGEFIQPQATFGEPGDLGPRNMPQNFNYQSGAYANTPQATLIEAGSHAAQQAQAFARTAGPTASARATQAGAMARVLSVTDSPTGNMLPLVAPAAHAVVSAAAAKPQSEHIVTSGYGPSQGMSGQSMQGAGHADGAQAGAGHKGDDTGHDAQDVDVLAAKIARSVLLKMQRERERRGNYG
jgi:hypothetical protein